MSNKCLIICIGISNSGKTFWCKELQRKEPGVWKHISRDDIRLSLDDYVLNNKNEEFVTEIEEILISKALSHHYSVLSDATHLKQSYINDVCDIVYKHNKLYNDNVEIVLKYFPITLEEALERNEKRTGQPKVPEKIIREMIERYNKNVPFIIKPTEDKTITQDNKLPKAAYFDIDGTLAHNTSRNIYDYEKCDTDLVDVRIRELVWMYKDKGFKIIFCSGRDDIVFQKTCNWLGGNNLPFDDLFMRKTGDKRRDSIIKEEIIRNSILPKYQLYIAFDDRNQVVQMLRTLGIKTLQVAEGDF